MIPANAGVAHPVERHLAKVEVASSSLVTRSRKEEPFVYPTKGFSFQRNPPCRVGEIIFDDEIPFGDEIRLDGGWVDFISSAKQISSELRSDFIALARFH